ncbi:MAG: hypothetical protein ACE5EC_03170 [Phycisphaerae bacterium]
MTILAIALACSFGISAAYAGPGCTAKKDSKVKTAKSSCSAKAARTAKSCCASEGFPSLTRFVGDKAVGCPMAAEKLAKEQGAEIIFAIGDKKFCCKKSAMKALAKASEDYVTRFTSIACVIDGKVKYCGDSCRGTKATLTSAGCKSSCGSAKTTLASTDQCHEIFAKMMKLAKADAKDCCAATLDKFAKSLCEATCTSGKKAGLVKADGKGTCSASRTKLTKADGKACCKAGKKASLAKADGKSTCSASKAKLTKAKGKACCKAGKKASLAKADDGKACCKTAKNVKFRVAGREFDKWEDAVKARDEVRAAVKLVKMSYLVDGKKVDCSSQICPKAKAAGKVKFVVADQETSCEITARIALAHAQFEAAQNIDNKKVATVLTGSDASN